MNPSTHQTIRLSRGKHTCPEEGACVMELASMLAGETFSDHPQSVCPVIGSFLRTYNDSVDERRRQTLYPCAAKVVGSHGSNELTDARVRYLNSLVAELRARRHPWTRLLPTFLLQLTNPRIEMIAARAARVVAAQEDAMQLNVSQLIDDLIAFGANEHTAGDPYTSEARRSEAEGMLRLGQLVETAP